LVVVIVTFYGWVSWVIKWPKIILQARFSNRAVRLLLVPVIRELVYGTIPIFPGTFDRLGLLPARVLAHHSIVVLNVVLAFIVIHAVHFKIIVEWKRFLLVLFFARVAVRAAGLCRRAPEITVVFAGFNLALFRFANVTDINIHVNPLGHLHAIPDFLLVARLAVRHARGLLRAVSRAVRSVILLIFTYHRTRWARGAFATSLLRMVWFRQRVVLVTRVIVHLAMRMTVFHIVHNAFPVRRHVAPVPSLQGSLVQLAQSGMGGFVLKPTSLGTAFVFAPLAICYRSLVWLAKVSAVQVLRSHALAV
jgi:hypothetical protein